ncbi:MAG: hypothetical protein KY460_11735, partial [Actinobacteria bacterium]|nr:hypothetical protein [Actinomycetota bacterium]
TEPEQVGPAADVDLLGEDEQPERGRSYAVPDGWPVARETIFGYATLVGDDLIEYSIGDGEIIATCAPATEDPPGCA